MEENDVANVENMIDALLARTDAAIARFYVVDDPDNRVAGETILVENNSGQDMGVQNVEMENMSVEDMTVGEDFDFPTHDGEVDNSGVSAEEELHFDGSAGADAEDDRHNGGNAVEDREDDVDAGGAEAEEDRHAEVDAADAADEGEHPFVDLMEILREVAGSNILFVRVDGLLDEHVRRGGYHSRTNLTHFFELPGCYDFSYASLTEWDTENDALCFTDAAHWLHRCRLQEMSASDFADASIHKFGYSTISAKSRTFAMKRKLERSGFPMREYLPRLEHIIINLPDGMLAHLEAEQNVRNNLTDENVRSVWHADGAVYIGHRTARSEMVELVYDRGELERISRSFSESVCILARKNGGRDSILTTDENDRLVQEFTSRVQQEHRRVQDEMQRLRIQRQDRYANQVITGCWRA